MEPLEIRPGLIIPAGDLSMTATRASGPGGQHVNKASTRVTLRFALSTTTTLEPEVRERLARLARRRLTDEGDLLISGQRYRSQVRNLEDCRTRLRDLVLRALDVPPDRRSTRPSRAARQARLADKAHQSRKKRERRPPQPDE
ncbi:MAG: alternative ribosome rescue aminoacyl-tRNA hydrolase ArfB [Candidatus Eiseniibacteriota bacterium]|jgi:ribosome-associated protein